MLEMFSYSFMVRALVAGTLVSVCAALLGVSLVLRRCSMIGDGLSHVGFGALAVAAAMNAAPMAVAAPVVLAGAFLLLKISDDAAIALLSTASLAVGVLAVSMTTGMNTNVYSYMFGSALAMSDADVYMSVALSAVVLALFTLCRDKIFAVTFDETFARACGVRAEAYNTLTAALTALTIVPGMKVMGALLITGLIVFPPMTAMRLCGSFRGATICSAAIAAACFFAGLALSYSCSAPTGATVVAVNALAFAAASMKKPR
ncbi:MAG: metal ABC transporter permease [Synergistaceae bacterium]|jgi:zinc transport system permease protein|nr:metal ABC transporter permease [Synergistaceae bacterium]